MDAVGRLNELTRRLRRDCPWDREQDERSIVPHTVEEAYELADAANSGDDDKLRDELGDVLYQVLFLALLLEERRSGDLAAVADHCHDKLVRRHPHVFGDVSASTPGEVKRNWDAIKRTERGRAPSAFGAAPANLPAALYAKKTQKQAQNLGATEVDARSEAAQRLERLGAEGAADKGFAEIGDLLFACVAVARQCDVDPELALRAATDRFKQRVEGGLGEHA